MRAAAKTIEVLLLLILAVLVWLLADIGAAGYHSDNAAIYHEGYTDVGIALFAWAVVRAFSKD